MGFKIGAIYIYACGWYTPFYFKVIGYNEKSNRYRIEVLHSKKDWTILKPHSFIYMKYNTERNFIKEYKGTLEELKDKIMVENL